MTTPEFRAVLFDLDDTLIDRKSAYEKVYRTLYDRNEAIHSRTPWDEAIKYFWTLSPDNATIPREAFVEIQRRWPGVAGDPDFHQQFFFEQMLTFMKMVPRAMDFVEWMNGSGVRWGVVTNGDQFQLEKLEATGLKNHVPFAVVSKVFGVDKPAPEVFMEAVRLLDIPGMRTEEILFVGDNPHTDIIGAHGVGMKTAWIRMGREYPDDAPYPDIIVDHVEELKTRLA